MTTRTSDQRQLYGIVLPGLLAVALLGLGLEGLIRRISTGHEQVAYGSYVPWGLWVAMYVYLVWLEVGSLLIFTTMTYIFGWNKGLPSIKGPVYLTALTALTPALLLIALDLGHPLRFWKTIINPNFGSPMAWMVWFHLIYLVILIAKVMLVLRANGKPDQAAPGWALKALAYISIPVGFVLIATVGSIFGVLAARPLWQYTVLPLYFLISSLVAGSALVTALYVWFAPDKDDAVYRESTAKLGALTKGLLLFGAVAAAMSGLVSFYSNVPAQVQAVRLALFGPYWWSFWILHVGLGVVLPAILLFVWPRRAQVVGLAAVLVVTMFVVVPFNVIIPAQVATDIQNLAEAFTGFGLSLSYIPTRTEWQVTLFALGVGIATFLLAYHFLPVRSIWNEKDGS